MVLGGAGERGGAGAERGGNDGDLVKLTDFWGIFMKIPKFVIIFYLSLNSMKIAKTGLFKLKNKYQVDYNEFELKII